MFSFHNQPATKEFYVQRVSGHLQADEIIHNRYWVDGKGCGVGCTIHSDNHKMYESDLGIPEVLAHLEDYLFEGCHIAEAQQFAINFLQTIPVGVDLSGVVWRFLHWLIMDQKEGISQGVAQADEKELTHAIASLLLKACTQPVEKQEVEAVGQRLCSAFDAGRIERPYLLWSAIAAMLEIKREDCRAVQVQLVMIHWVNSRPESKTDCYKMLAGKLCQLLSQAR